MKKNQKLRKITSGKRFHFAIPKTERKPKEPKNLDPNRLYVGGKRISIRYSNNYLFNKANVPVYYAIPNASHWRELETRYGVGNVPITRAQYIDHRQMDVGRAIARGLHGRRILIGTEDNVWQFREVYFEREEYFDEEDQITKRRDARKTRDWFVNWDGLNPPINSIALGVSNPYNATIYQGRDSYLWAVYFLVNGSPEDNLWFPIPTRNPDWNSLNIGEPVPDYAIVY